MRYISLKNTSLSYFNNSGLLSELSGSSKYNLYDHNIELKPTRKKNDIENQNCTTEYLEFIKKNNLEHNTIKALKLRFKKLLELCIIANFNDIPELKILNQINDFLQRVKYAGEISAIEIELINKIAEERKSMYYREKPIIKAENKINKTKVKSKMFAMFNLKCSKKFIAFYSVSFPLNTSDNSAFVCWNYWLTALRKRFDLTNYIWVAERQKNNTLHFHMLTNNYLPILQINRAMAIIINNQVKAGSISWGESSIDKYNGVDVDSIYNSKRHKKSGKNLNPAEIRNWISKYVTKYVTKNNESFKHLCWHCSRSISILFTAQTYLFEDSVKITSHLPTLRHLYNNYKSEFIDCWVFLFVPPEHLFDKIKMYNDIIFKEFEPKFKKHSSYFTFKSTTL